MAGAYTNDIYIPYSPIMGKKNPDGTYTLQAGDIKHLNDMLYLMSKKLMGGITLSDLTDAANVEFTGKVSFTDLSDPDSETVINGGLITTGTIDADLITTGTLSADRVSGGTLEGVEIISESAGGYYVYIHDGTIELYSDPYGPSTGLPRASFNIYSGAAVLQNMFSTVPLKIAGVGNMSIDATNGKVYIGASSSGSKEVYIGTTGGRVDLYGDVYINGVLQT